MVVMLSIIAGFMVANIYYNQPLLEVIAKELRVTSIESNLLAVLTQVGYAFGLLLIIPMGDLYNRRKLTLACIIISLLMTAIMSVTYSIYIMWIASFFIGISSIVPQIFMPIAGQLTMTGLSIHVWVIFTDTLYITLEFLLIYFTQL